jgi:hypothetical protein
VFARARSRRVNSDGSSLVTTREAVTVHLEEGGIPFYLFRWSRGKLFR